MNSSASGLSMSTPHFVQPPRYSLGGQARDKILSRMRDRESMVATPGITGTTVSARVDSARLAVQLQDVNVIGTSQNLVLTEVRHPMLSSLEPRDILRFLDLRKVYLATVPGDRTVKLVNSLELWLAQYIQRRIFKDNMMEDASLLIFLQGLAREAQISKTIKELVGEIRMDAKITDLTTRIAKWDSRVEESLSVFGYDSAIDDNPKAFQEYLSAIVDENSKVIFPPILAKLVRKLAYQAKIKKVLTTRNDLVEIITEAATMVEDVLEDIPEEKVVIAHAAQIKMNSSKSEEFKHDGKKRDREDEKRKIQQGDGDQKFRKVTSSIVSKEPRKCFRCGEVGHYKRECKEKKKVGVSNFAGAGLQSTFKGILNDREADCMCDSGSLKNVISKDNSAIQGMKHFSSEVKEILTVSGILPVLFEVHFKLNLITDNGNLWFGEVSALVVESPLAHLLIGEEDLVKVGFNIRDIINKLAVKRVIPSMTASRVFEKSVEEIKVENDALELPPFEELFPVGDSCSEKDKLLFLEFYHKELKDLLADDGLTCAIDYPPAEIVTKPDLPERLHARPRNLSAEKMDFLVKHLESLQKQGLIEPAQRTVKYLSPVLLVPKSKGKYRMVVDLTGVNKYIEKEVYELPRLSEIQFKMSNSAKFFAKLDIKDAFWGVNLHPKSRELMSFTTPVGNFTPLRTLQGAINSGLGFQRMIDEVLVDCIRDNICFP
jgi:hypothetical protein